MQLSWRSGTTLRPRDWAAYKASVRSSCQLWNAVRDGTPSGARIGDHALHIVMPSLGTGTGFAHVDVCRGPAVASIRVILDGRPDAAAVRLAEQLAERFCRRVDRVLEYILAKTFTLKAGGEKLECRQVPSGALVGDLGALCDAIDAGIRVEQDGELLVLRLGKKEVRLQVGYETAEVGKAGAKLHFPTLKWSEDGYIADLSGIAVLLGAKVKY